MGIPANGAPTFDSLLKILFAGHSGVMTHGYSRKRCPYNRASIKIVFLTKNIPNYKNL